MIVKLLKKTLQMLLGFLTPVTKVTPRIVVLSQNKLLNGRIALITGGTSGIGFEIARSFINAGARVIITGRSQDRVDKAVNLLRDEYNNKESVYGIVMDITDIEAIKAKVNEAILMVKGNLDILVNNAGINGGNFINGTPEEFDNVINTNLKGVFFLSKEIADYMMKNKIEGNILNVASSSSLRPAISAYGLSKWSIVGLTRGLARLLAPKGIIVNGIAPGPTATPMQGVSKGEDIGLASNLVGRFALPEEIGSMAVILVSHMSRMIVGDVIYMTGGSGLVYNEDINYPFDNN